MHEYDELVCDVGYSKFIVRHFIDREGKKRKWGMVQNNVFGPGAQVFAVTLVHTVILERSYRIPLKEHIIELPGGSNDIAGESFEQIVRRELAEETGYSGGEYHFLAEVAESPGLTDQKNQLFFAYGVEMSGVPLLGADETIEVLEVPVKGLVAYLRSKKEPVDSKVYAAISLLPLEFLREAMG